MTNSCKLKWNNIPSCIIFYCETLMSVVIKTLHNIMPPLVPNAFIFAATKPSMYSFTFIYPSFVHVESNYAMFYLNTYVSRRIESALRVHMHRTRFAVIRVSSVEVLNFPLTIRDNWDSFNVYIGPRARTGMRYALMMYTYGYNWVLMHCNTTKDSTQSHSHVLCIGTRNPQRSARTCNCASAPTQTHETLWSLDFRLKHLEMPPLLH
jgi:hypothetical protein